MFWTRWGGGGGCLVSDMFQRECLFVNPFSTFDLAKLILNVNHAFPDNIIAQHQGSML